MASSETSPLPYTTSPSLAACHTSTPAQFLSARPHIHRLLSSSLVFSTTNDDSSSNSNSSKSRPRLLLVRRVASDSFSLKWEPPGGCVDPSDKSLVGTAVRELYEETGLRASHIHCAVGMVTEDEQRLLLCQASSGGADVDLNAGLTVLPADENAGMEPDGAVTTFWGSGTQWGKATYITTARDDDGNSGNGAPPRVVLRPEEHDKWAWVSEDELRSGHFDTGVLIEYPSNGLRRTLLKGFQLWRELDAASSAS